MAVWFLSEVKLETSHLRVVLCSCMVVSLWWRNYWSSFFKMPNFLILETGNLLGPHRVGDFLPCAFSFILATLGGDHWEDMTASWPTKWKKSQRAHPIPCPWNKCPSHYSHTREPLQECSLERIIYSWDYLGCIRGWTSSRPLQTLKILTGRCRHLLTLQPLKISLIRSC